MDAKLFREVMGNFPTGVVVATAMSGDTPVGMTLGSFVSVSLDPPLVAIIPTRTSTTFPKIREAGSFCVNVLSDGQEHVCRAFASKGADKFRDVPWSPAPSGSPRLTGNVAWIDCDVETVHEAGDHYIVIGRVRDLGTDNPALPLLFLQGGYGRFFTPTLTVRPDVVVARSLPMADAARGPLESLSARIGMECTATIATGEVLIPMLSTGAPESRVNPPMLGNRFPFKPPFGMVFAAWADPAVLSDWMGRDAKSSDDVAAGRLTSSLAIIRERGWWAVLRDTAFAEVEAQLGLDSVSMVSPRQLKSLDESIARIEIELGEVDPDADYDVRLLGVPAFGPSGRAELTLSVHPDKTMTGAELEDLATELNATAHEVSTLLAVIDRV